MVPRQPGYGIRYKAVGFQIRTRQVTIITRPHPVNHGGIGLRGAYRLLRRLIKTEATWIAAGDSRPFQYRGHCHQLVLIL